MATAAEMRSQADAQKIATDLASTVFTADNDAALNQHINQVKETSIEYKRLASEEARQEYEQAVKDNFLRNQTIDANRAERRGLDQAQGQVVRDNRVMGLLAKAGELDARLAVEAQSSPMTPWSMPLDLLREGTQVMQELERAGKDLGVLPGAEQPPQPQPKHPETFPDGERVHVVQLQNGKLEAQLVTGEVFRGDPLEVTKQLAEAQVSTKRWGQQQRDAARQQPQAQPQQPQNGNSNALSYQNGIPSVDLSKVDDVSRWQFDSMAKTLGYTDGQEMVNDQIAQRQRTQQLEQQVTQMREAQENVQIAGDFTLRNPDFPGSQESINALTQIMDSNGLEYTADNLGMAHNYAVKTGMYKPLTQDDINFVHQVAANGGQITPSMRASNNTPPPAPPRAGSADYGRPVQGPWEMPLDELRKQALYGQQSGESTIESRR